MMNSRMWVYPWDFVDEGFDAVLDRLQGEVGLGGVTMPVACAATRYLRMREVAPRWVGSPGGLFFHPDEGRYQSTRCKPVLAAGLKSRDPLTEAIERCERCGMKLFASVSASRMGRMAERYPETATVNAFDAPSAKSLCLANPDVRALLGDLLEDLTHDRAIAGVIIEDLDIAWAEADDANLLGGPPSKAVSSDALAGNDDAGAGPAPGAAERSLLRLCFCPSCLQGAEAADVDAGAAKQSVAVILQKAFSAGGSGLNVPAVIADNPPLREMLSWRQSSIAALYRRCTEHVSCPITVSVRSADEAAVLTTAAESRPTLLIAADGLSPPSWWDRMGEAAWETRFRPAAIWSTDAAELVRGFQSLAQAGCRSAEVAHYGIVPETMMVALKQAVRFDRRAG